MKTQPKAKKTSARIFSLESNGKQKRGVPSPFDTILNQSEHIWMNNKQGRHFLTVILNISEKYQDIILIILGPIYLLDITRAWQMKLCRLWLLATLYFGNVI